MRSARDIIRPSLSWKKKKLFTFGDCHANFFLTGPRNFSVGVYLNFLEIAFPTFCSIHSKHTRVLVLIFGVPTMIPLSLQLHISKTRATYAFFTQNHSKYMSIRTSKLVLVYSSVEYGYKNFFFFFLLALFFDKKQCRFLPPQFTFWRIMSVEE